MRSNGSWIKQELLFEDGEVFKKDIDPIIIEMFGDENGGEKDNEEAYWGADEIAIEFDWTGLHVVDK